MLIGLQEQPFEIAIVAASVPPRSASAIGCALRARCVPGATPHRGRGDQARPARSRFPGLRALDRERLAAGVRKSRRQPADRVELADEHVRKYSLGIFADPQHLRGAAHQRFGECSPPALTMVGPMSPRLDHEIPAGRWAEPCWSQRVSTWCDQRDQPWLAWYRPGNCV